MDDVETDLDRLRDEVQRLRRRNAELEAADVAHQHVVQALSESEARYRTLVEHFPNGAVFLFDQELRYTVAGGVGLGVNQLSPERIKGKTIWELFPPEIAARDEPVLRAALQGEATRVEVVYGEKTFVVHTVPVTDEHDTIVGGMVMTQDITARKQLEVAAADLLVREQAARAEAQEAVRIRDGFLSLAAHELKTPLTTLLGNAGLLQRRTTRDQSLNERDQRALTSIIQQARRLNQLTGDLLDVSHLDTGQLGIEPVQLDVRMLVQRVVAQAQTGVEHHTLTVCLPDEPLLVAGDELRLEQVLENLLGNAIKYSPEGGEVVVHAEQQASEVWLAVTDQGIGMAPDVLPQLFQRFYRAANAEALGIRGSGIGLYVVNEIVRLHGGRVDVESSEGQGSTFRICLPALT